MDSNTIKKDNLTDLASKLEQNNQSQPQNSGSDDSKGNSNQPTEQENLAENQAVNSDGKVVDLGLSGQRIVNK